jgi:dephospho-CoA kinase
MIIGLTSSYSAGKDSVADYLSKKGFVHISLSDLIREQMKKAGVEITRENMIPFANNLRQKFGHGILSEIALKKMAQDKNYVVSSLRHPAEIKALQSGKNFVLVGIDAPARLRFERALARNREKEPRTFEEFLARERQEMQDSGPGQQLHKCFDMAGIVILNTGTKNLLYQKVDRMLSDLRS